MSARNATLRFVDVARAVAAPVGVEPDAHALRAVVAPTRAAPARTAHRVVNLLVIARSIVYNCYIKMSGCVLHGTFTLESFGSVTEPVDRVTEA
jgi:hypothetical protein